MSTPSRFCTTFILGSIILVSLLIAPTAKSVVGGGGETGQWVEAEKLFREGQNAMSLDNYLAAVEAFRRAREASGDSSRTADALYWEAFARYRQGGSMQLKQAEQLIQELATRYASRTNLAEVAELLTRVRGELARDGDAEAAAQIEAKAAELEARAAALEARTQEIETARLNEELQVLQERQLRALEEAKQHHELGPFASNRPWIPVDPFFVPDSPQEDDVRILALSALAESDPDRALPILASVLTRRDEGSERLRERAVLILSFHRSKEGERLLLDVAQNDPDPTVRGRALILLGELKSKEAFEIIETILMKETDPQLQRAAIQALMMQDDEKANRVLRTVAEREDFSAEVRGRAIRWLGIEGNKDDAAFLRALYAGTNDPELKQEIVMGIGDRNDDAARDWFLTLLGDKETPASIRERAFFWVGENKKVPTERLIELYRNFEPGKMKRQAVHVIAQRDDSAARDFIIQVAQDESSPEAQRAAIFWLGRLDDPRVVPILEKMIGNK